MAEVQMTEVNQTDVDIAEANPVKGGDNAEEKSRPSHFGGNDKNPSKLEKFTKSVNVRLVNYTHSSVMALFIAIVTFVAFILLMVAMSTSCPVETKSVEKTIYNGGVLQMQMDLIDKLINPENLEDMIKNSKNFKRTVDVCIIRAAANVAVQTDEVTLNEGKKAYMLHKKECQLPTDAMFQQMAKLPKDDGGNPLFANLKWCKGKSLSLCPAGGDCEKSQPQEADALQCEAMEKGLDAGSLGRDFTVHMTYKITESKEVCPTATSIIGSALAYIAYLEMFATLLVGFVLIKLGVAKPLNERATIMGLLKSANSDTSKVEDAIDSLRNDVDTIMKDKDDLDDDQTKRIESLEEKLALMAEEAK
jgi:hypothetical protein